MFKTITKAKLDDAVKTGGTMGDVVFTMKRCMEFTNHVHG